MTNDKHVRCITGWTDLSSLRDDGNFTQYTKCIRIGKGWSVSNNVAGFEIRNRTAQRGDPLADNDVVINIYFSDRATYFNETTDFGSGLGSCSADSSYADCHWDDIFSSSLPPNLNRVSKNSLVVETYLRSTEGKTGIWIDSTNYPVWADYQLGLSPFIDPVVATANTTAPNASTTTPLVIHPNWLLAAWSVDTSRVINGTSTVGSMFANIVNRDLDSDSSSETGSIEIFTVQLLTTAQALSLIPYNFTDLRHSHAPTRKNDVYFYYWRSRRVWMYSIGSRTAKLGVVIVMIGMVVVVLRTFLAVYEKLIHNYVTRVLSPTELVVATLSHQPEGEFDHCVDETASAQVRFRIGDEGGVLKFRPQKTKSQ